MANSNRFGSGRPRVVYLDQNVWIALARAVHRPTDHPSLQRLIRRTLKDVEAQRLILPLTSTILYETYKVGDLRRRRDLASLQASLSQGRVIRGRETRLEAEICAVVANCCNLAPPPREPQWFLSNIFLEAFADWDDARITFRISEQVVSMIRANPAECLYDYLVESMEDVRTAAVKKFSDGSERLRSLIEQRRSEHAKETFAMRRRIYSALLLYENIERIIRLANAMGIPWRDVQDIGDKSARRIIEEVPTYYIEREIALRLEAQDRPIEENDFRDMQSFCAAIPYADLVIGEKQFINLAQQARLDQKFNTQLSTDIHALGDLLGWR